MSCAFVNLRRWVCCAVFVAAAAAIAWAEEPAREGVEYFEKHVRPLLVEHCYECHDGSGASAVKSGFRLDVREGLLRGGKSGSPAIVPGDADRSRLIKAVRRSDPELQMPPKH